MGLDRHDIRRALVRAYCHGPNRHKPVDADLIEDMADEIMVTVDNLIMRHIDGISRQHETATGATLTDWRN